MENILSGTSHCPTDCVIIRSPCCGWDMMERVVQETVTQAAAAGVNKVVFIGSPCCGDSEDLKKISQRLSNHSIQCCWVDRDGSGFGLPVRLESWTQIPELVKFAERYNAGYRFLDLMDRLRKENKKRLFDELKSAWKDILRKYNVNTLTNTPFGISEFVSIFPDDRE